MSAPPGQGKRHGAGNRKIKNMNAGSPSEWKVKGKTTTNGSPGSASSGQKHDSSITGECASVKVSAYSPEPVLDVQSQQEPLLPRVNDGASATEKLSLTPNSCQKEDSNLKQSRSTPSSDYISEDFRTLSEKGKLSGDVSREKDSTEKLDDTSHASPVMSFDICIKKAGTFVKLKPSLLDQNKEKRIQQKRSMEGPNIDMLRPGMVLMKGYISLEEQIRIVNTCRELGIGEGGFYQPGYRVGAKLHLKMMCLGKNWDPQSSQYDDVRPFDNSKPPGIPDKFHDMVRKAIQDANAHVQKTNAKAGTGELVPSMIPDICIVNFYTKEGKLGLHQDKDESSGSLKKGLPVVSFSIGQTAEFLYGDDRDVEKAEKVELESGDVLIFGGKSRHIFHGVTSIKADAAPTGLLAETNMRPGRLNLTFRQY